MGKILVWVIIALVVMMVMRIVASRAASRQAPPPKNDQAGRGSAARPGAGARSGAGTSAGNASNTDPASRADGASTGWTPPWKRGKTPGAVLRGQPDPTLGAAEEMVRCAHCGIFLPRSEALLKSGKTWCSNTHAQLGVRQD